MAKTRDYMDYLDDSIGIAPANSQEEFQAAETIVEVMKDHGLEPTIQEFDSRPLGSLMPNVLAIVMFVGILLSGIGPVALRVLGLVLTIIPMCCVIAMHAGHDVFANFGPASRSQNVIAVHRATGDKVVKGSRPIVIVAHYDSPHESSLYSGALAKHHVALKKASFPCSLVVTIAAVLQVMGFVPGGARTVAWVVGLVVSLPLLLLAVATIAERFTPCTLGANDNKSSVAAMLSVLAKVRPGDDRVDAQLSGREYTRRDDETESAQEQEAPQQNEHVYGVRHGKEVLEELGILPETCEIVYDDTSMANGPTQSQKGEEQEVSDGTEDTEDVEGGYVSDYASDGEGYEPDSPTYSDDDEADGTTLDDEAPSEDETTETDGTYLEEEPYDDTADEDTADDYGPDDVPYEDDTYDEQDYDGDYETVDDEDGIVESGQDKKGQGGIKGVFKSIKGFFSRRKSGEDVSIPRGRGGEEIDFSEFEETDWEDTPQDDDLRPISREDFGSGRLTWGAESDSAQVGYGDAPTDASGIDETYDEYEGPEEPADANTADDEQDVPDSDVERGERQPSVIDHGNQPDWSVVEEDEGSSESSEDDGEASYQPSPYQQDAEVDDCYEEDAGDLDEVEDALDADQLASQTARPQDAGPDDGLFWDDDVDQKGGEDDEEGATAEIPVRAKRGAKPSFGNRVKSAFSNKRQETKDDGETGENPSDDADEKPTTNDIPDADRVHEPADESPEAQDLRRRSRLSFDEDTDDSGVLPKDTRGLDTISDSYDVYEDAVDQPETPDPIDDPTWGTSSYVPPKPKVNVARRAALYDLPDPSEESVDPLDDDDEYYEEDERDREGNREDDSRDESQDGRKDNWKGGAAVRSDLTGDSPDDEEDEYGDEDYENDPDDGYVDGYPDESDGDGRDSDSGLYEDEAAADDDEPVVIDQDDLQDAILEMGDDYLISHDIWFVAVGSSSVGHAGIRAFLSNFRQDIRGAFLINLDCVGAGALAVTTREGLDAGRRTDRRLVRLATNVGDDLHIDLQRLDVDWDDTDATSAMRSRVRAVTIMGVDDNGLPALSHSHDDVPENVSPRQVASVARLITEVIRRA